MTIVIRDTRAASMVEIPASAAPVAPPATMPEIDPATVRAVMLAMVSQGWTPPAIPTAAPRVASAPVPAAPRLAPGETIDRVTGEIRAKRSPGRPRKVDAAPAIVVPSSVAAPAAPVGLTPRAGFVFVKGWEPAKMRELGATFNAAAKAWEVPAAREGEARGIQAASEAARAAKRAAKLGGIDDKIGAKDPAVAAIAASLLPVRRRIVSGG